TSAADSSNGSAVFQTGNDFGAVWHLNEDPDGDPSNGILDRTSNGNHGTPGGSMTTADLVDGVVGKGIQFDDDASDDYIDVDDGGLVYSSGTVSLWGKPGTFDTDHHFFFNHTSLAAGNADRIHIYTNDADGWLDINLGDYGTATGLYDMTVDTWYHIALTWDETGSGSGDFNVYVNGALDTSDTYANLDGPILNANLGNSGNAANLIEPLEGALDEVRVSTDVRGADWIKLCYENQKTGQTLMDVEDYAADWSYNQTITLNTTSSGADVENAVYDFPVLLRFTAENFTFSQALDSGKDVRFAKSDGSTPLFYDIERWDSANALAEVWVKVDTVAGNSTTEFTMYWGNSSASDWSFPNVVFDTDNSFGGVWHLNEDPNGDPANGIKDRTSNANHGTPGGSMTTADLVDGVVGKGIQFDDDDSDDYVDVDDGGLDYTVGTVSLWGKPGTFDTDVHFFFSHTSLADGNADRIHIYTNDADGWLDISLGDFDHATGLYDMTVDTWYHIALTWDETSGGAGDYEVYVNGALDTSGTYDNLDGPILNANFGNNGNAANLIEPLEGALDEVRISTAVRGADWIKLCYENQKSDQTLVEWPSIPDDYAKAVRFTFNPTSSSYSGSTVSDFPLFLRITSGDIDFSAAKSDGSDILFVDSGGSYLYHSVTEWDQGSETAKVWVKIPSVALQHSNDYVDMYYSCAGCASTYANEDSVFMGYEAVWHLPNGETQARDATGNG
ncbi:DUF2341 domain-containing protein, partial [Fibrobacterota bacterium]